MSMHCHRQYDVWLRLSTYFLVVEHIWCRIIAMYRVASHQMMHTASKLNINLRRIDDRNDRADICRCCFAHASRALSFRIWINCWWWTNTCSESALCTQHVRKVCSSPAQLCIHSSYNTAQPFGTIARRRRARPLRGTTPVHSRTFIAPFKLVPSQKSIN